MQKIMLLCYWGHLKVKFIKDLDGDIIYFLNYLEFIISILISQKFSLNSLLDVSLSLKSAYCPII